MKYWDGSKPFVISIFLGDEDPLWGSTSPFEGGISPGLGLSMAWRLGCVNSAQEEILKQNHQQFRILQACEAAVGCTRVQEFGPRTECFLFFLGGGHQTPMATWPFSFPKQLKVWSFETLSLEALKLFTYQIQIGGALPQARLDDLYEYLNPEGSNILGAPIPYLQGDKSCLSPPNLPASLPWLEGLEVHQEPGDWDAFSLFLSRKDRKGMKIEIKQQK